MEPTAWEVLFAVVTLPMQIVYHIITGLLNTLVFDVLQLGPYLPLG